MRVRNPVWTDQTVAVEVLVIIAVVVVVISCVGVIFNTVSIFLAQPLVHKIPDESSLEFRIFAHEIPIFLESAAGVAHCVGIFALDERLGVFRSIAERVGFAFVLRQVHRTEDLGIWSLDCPFPVNRAALVLRLDPLESSRKVRSVSCFVTKRPVDDARMVEVHGNIVDVPLQNLFLKFRPVGKGFFSVLESV